MRFIFNGDSNVAGSELKNPSQESMAAVISDYYNAECINLALPGSSNDRIYSTTIEFLKTNPSPDFLMIGWTEHGREQWWFDGMMHEVNQLEVGNRIPEQFRRRYQFWKRQIQYNSDWHRVMGFYWHNKIYNLHTLLKERNVPHLFFHAFFPFEIPDEERLDWHHNFYHPYSKPYTYINQCIQRGFQEITPGWFHFNAEAHQSWSSTMIDEITKNQIL